MPSSKSFSLVASTHRLRFSASAASASFSSVRFLSRFRDIAGDMGMGPLQRFGLENLYTWKGRYGGSSDTSNNITLGVDQVKFEGTRIQPMKKYRERRHGRIWMAARSGRY